MMSADARFLKYVERLPNGCWFWTGARSKGSGNKKWYGSFFDGKKVVRAHIYAHDVFAGKACPPGYHRDHTCRFSLCVNPDHLEAVPPASNQERVKEHGLITLTKMARDLCQPNGRSKGASN